MIDGWDLFQQIEVCEIWNCILHTDWLSHYRSNVRKNSDVQVDPHVCRCNRQVRISGRNWVIQRIVDVNTYCMLFLCSHCHKCIFYLLEISCRDCYINSYHHFLCHLEHNVNLAGYHHLSHHCFLMRNNQIRILYNIYLYDRCYTNICC